MPQPEVDRMAADLRAQLGEDERVAQEAERYGDFAQTGWGILTATALHVGRHDPAWVLRQVAAHRAILDQYEAMRAGVEAAEGTILAAAARVRLGAYEFCVRHLAAAYADRDGRPV